MVNYTPNLRLTQPDFDQTPWDEQINGDLSILDTAYGAFIAINGLSGVWQNSVAYLVGQSVIDTTNSSVWQCNVAHTSAAAPTIFSQDRTAHPTYWSNVVTGIVYLPITGGTLTGSVGITSPAGTSRGIAFYTGSTTRWLLQTGGEGETGGNAGSNFSLVRYSDAGASLDVPLQVSRATGDVSVNNIATNGAIKFANTGGYIVGNASTVTFAQDGSLWRWEYIRTGIAGGTMQYTRGYDSHPLFVISPDGTITSAGVNTGIINATTISATSVQATDLHATSTVKSGGGVYYTSEDPLYYFQRRVSDGHWCMVENNVTIFDLSNTGSLAIPGNVAPRNGQSVFGVGGAGVILQFAPGWFFDWATATGSLVWDTPAGTMMVLDSTGNFAVSGRVTCNDISNTTGVFYTGAGAGYYFARNSADGHWRWVENSITNMELDAVGSLSCKTNISAGFDIIAGGTGRKPGGGSWDVPSDLRLKQDVVDYTSGLAIINQLQPIEFSYVPETGFDTTLRHVGLAAQDIQDIMPNAVKSVPVADMPEAGSDLAKSVDDVLVVNHNELLFALVNAVKELQARIVELENAP